MIPESTEAKLIRFITNELRKGVTLFELHHCANQRESVMRQYPIDPSDAEAADVAADLLKDAAEMVECFAAPQRFAVRSFIRASNLTCGEFGFLLPPSKDSNAAQSRSMEAPIERGLIVHLIRHTESAFATHVEISRQAAAMHKARADTAEREFQRLVAEKQRFAGLRSAEAEKAHQRKMEANEADRDHELFETGMSMLLPIFRAVRPDIARVFLELLPGFGKRRAAPSAPPPAPPKAEPHAEDVAHGEPSASNTQPTMKPDKNRQASHNADEDNKGESPREELNAALSELTQDQVDKLKSALGAEKMERLVTALFDMLR